MVGGYGATGNKKVKDRKRHIVVVSRKKKNIKKVLNQF
jgi:hypothetical protein